MKKYTLSLIISSVILSLLFFIYSCEDEEQNHNPTCSITEPLQDAEIMKGETVTITVSADDEDGNLKEVRFYIDDSGVSSTSTFPYKYEWNTSAVSLGNYTLKAEAIDEKNAKAEFTITVSIIDNQLGADFLADKTTITLGDTINFTDQSESIPSTWEWQFGNGGTSAEQNPSYVYYNAGIYSITLIVTNDFTSDTETKFNYITVQALPTISTNSISEYSSTTVIVGGNVASDGFSNVTDRGIYYGTTSNPENDGTKFQIGSGTGNYSDTITGLTINTTYYIRAYATNSVGTQNGSVVSFTTEDGLPVITTSEISSITAVSAVSGGEITEDGDFDITARGVCWSTNSNPTIEDDKTIDGTGIGDFNSNISNLELNTTYYVKSYATNSIGTSYGEELSFITDDGVPTLNTTSVSNINGSSAVSGGNITNDGGLNITARGICWSTSNNPTITDSHTTDGDGTGSYSSNITGLSPTTNYYVRSYATNSNGTFYGNQVSFTTENGLPAITTEEVTEITAVSAISGGVISDDGGFSVTARGVCWSTNPNPTTTDDHTSDGTGTENYSSNLSSLSVNTTYYVRAYATNSAGISYGDELNFTTDDGIPTIITDDIGDITNTDAISGGNITDNGGLPVTDRGVCWSTSNNPTIADNYTTDGTGVGSFTSSIIGLNELTVYYVRAYVTNDLGSHYGNEINFLTNGSVTDYDGNVYQTIQIGNQEWMKENLKTTHYSDGTAITLVENATSWDALSSTDKAYCYYDNSITNGNIYGALYTWAAAMNGSASSNSNPSGVQGACPDGWHVPSDDEWTELTDYLGGEDIAGGKMKEIGLLHWNTPNTGATNESRFTGLPNGRRYKEGVFGGLGNFETLWSTTKDLNPEDAFYRYLNYNDSKVLKAIYDKSSGHSIRCVKD